MFCKRKILENLKKIEDKPYLLYSILFGIMSIIIFFIFIETDKSFIWKPDGLKQHYAILYNYNIIIRNFLKNIADGFPMISWNMGLGLDTIGQYSYYIVGDLFAYISLLFPMKNLNIAYNLLIVVRIYFIGISFLYYCRYNKNKNINSLIGALIYAFCAYVIFASVRHPYFSNPLIMLPIVFVAVDKLFKENKKVFFIVSIFVTSIMNYYFFYMITILLAIYTLVRYIINNNATLDKKELAQKIIVEMLCYIVGIMLAAVILLPTIYSFLNSSRVGYNQTPAYETSYYNNLLTGLITVNANISNHSFIGISSIILILLPVFFNRRKQYKYVWQLFITFFIMILVPIIGSIMNGFSYPNNRWAFACSFLLSYIIVLTFDWNLKYSKKEILYMIASIVMYSLLLIIFINEKIQNECLISLLCATIMFMIIIANDNIKSRKYSCIFKFAMIILIMANICFMAKSKYNSYIEEFVDNDRVSETYSNGKYKEAIQKIKNTDREFYRIGNDNIWIYNSSLVLQYNSVNYYLSIGNKYVDELSYDLNNSRYDISRTLTGFDDRTKILTTLATKYYVINEKNKDILPYGYKLYDKNGKTETYINDNYLSVGIFYDNYTKKAEYDNLTPLQKDQSLLETAVLEDDSSIERYNVENNEEIIDNIKNDTTKNINYTIEDNSILKKDNTMEIKNTDNDENKIVLNIDSSINSEIYIEIKGITYEPYTIDELKRIELGKKYSSIDEKKFNDEYKNYNPSKTFSIQVKYKNKNNSIKVYDKEKEKYYVSRDSILMNLGYSYIHSGKIEIDFSKIGKYKFDSINIISVPMDKYETAVKKLKNNQLENVEYGNNYLSGTINTKTSGILQISTSYSDGWTAYVDGNKTEILKVNEAFIGIPLEKGNHTIVFKYETPYFKIGTIISIIGIFILIMITIIDVRKRRKEKWLKQ